MWQVFASSQTDGSTRNMSIETVTVGGTEDSDDDDDEDEDELLDIDDDGSDVENDSALVNSLTVQ